MIVDEVAAHLYRLAFRVRFLECRGDGFQNLFSDIMEKRYPGDFTRLRPWGNQGDRKNDGLLRSSQMLFQCYAPNEMKSRETVNKIDEDFRGAVQHWPADFHTWVFVHNSDLGLGPEVVRKLLDLQKEFTTYQLIHWGYEELRRIVESLGQNELSALFGPMSTRADVVNIEFPEIRLVIERLASLPESADQDLRPVSPRKLQANALSQAVEFLLRTGMYSSRRVGEFFDGYHDATLGDRVAQRFRDEYGRLRDAGNLPDDIFAELQVFAAGQSPVKPSRQAAALAVLAYLFEECDIFERPAPE